MKSKIYTSTGDKGTTSLVGGQRVAKDDIRVEAYGTVDELNACMGMITSNPDIDEMPGMPDFLHKMQNKLFNIGAYLATGNNAENPIMGLTANDITEIEAKIDEIDSTLPPMRGFILPGGSQLSSLCDVCRTVSRRAERRIVTLSHESHVDQLVLQYINRLSDFFFIFARFNNINHQIEENYWDKNA